jgi:hypothetical protein
VARTGHQVQQSGFASEVSYSLRHGIPSMTEAEFRQLRAVAVPKRVIFGVDDPQMSAADAAATVRRGSCRMNKTPADAQNESRAATAKSDINLVLLAASRIHRRVVDADLPVMTWLGGLVAEDVLASLPVADGQAYRAGVGRYQ